MSEDGDGQTIDKLYAWVATLPDGSEGLAGGYFKGLGTVPLIGADRVRIESYRTHAEIMARALKCRIQLKVFGAATVIDTIDVG